MKNFPLTLLWVVFLSIVFSKGHAQQVTDSLWLEELYVSASRVYVADEYQPVSIKRIDSVEIKLLSAGSNLGDILAALGPVHIRSNGPGGLSLISQRGMSPSQTQVLWNGFELNHSMLGQTDLSLLPAFAINSLKMASGAGNSSFGSKGGGTISLETNHAVNQIGLSQSIGSFGRQTTEFQAGTDINGWEFGISTGYINNENDFAYKGREFSNEAGGFVAIEKKRIHNQQQALTGIINLGKTSDAGEFKSMIWLYDSENNIPGPVNNTSGNAKQNDAYFRWMNSFAGFSHGFNYRIKSYIGRQKLDYFDPDNSISSLSSTNTFMADAELKKSLSRSIQLTAAIQLGYFLVDANEYASDVDRTLVSVHLSPVWHPLDRMHVFTSAKLDMYSDFGSAWSGESGLNIEVLRDVLFLKGQVGRNFIAPTFNDLYWPGAGNPDLNPETNIKTEAGIILKNSLFGLMSNKIDFSLYYSTVENGIRWLPLGGTSKPYNIEELELSGFELSDRIRINIPKGQISLSGMLIHSLATIVSARYDGDQTVGKQMRYVPEWQAKANAGVSWNGFSGILTYNFTEERFSSTDHSSPFDPLPAYKELNLVTHYSFKIRTLTVSPSFSLYNLLDEEYSIVQGYPMPGRNYMIKLSLQLTL